MSSLKKETLKNGLSLWKCMLPHTHCVSIDLLIRPGAMNEKKEEAGITHFIEHLFFRELNGKPQFDLYRKMESCGTTLMATTYLDCIHFSLKVSPLYFEKAFEIIGDILKTHSWSQEAIDQERRVVLREIEEKNENAIQFFSTQNVFEDSSYSNGILGNERTLRSFSKSQIEKKRDFLFSQSRILCLISGNYSSCQLKLAESVLNTITLPRARPMSASPKPGDFGNRRQNIWIEKNDWDLAEVDLAFDVNHQKVPLTDAEILNSLLGEGVGSLLQTKLREEAAYTYDVSSFVDHYRRFSVLHIRYSVAYEQILSSVRCVIKVINSLKERIAIEQLNTVLPFYNENMDFYLDDPQKLNRLVGWYEFILDSSFEKTKWKATVQTASCFSSYAQSIFIPSNASLTILGNCRFSEEKLSSALEELR